MVVSGERERNIYRKYYLQNENHTFSEIVDIKFLEIIFNGSNFLEIEDNIRLFKMLKDEPFQHVFMNILTFHRGFLSEILEKFLLEAHQHGIIESIRRKFYQFGPNFKEEIVSDPEKLSLYVLSAGFIVWLGTVGIACLIFLYEQIKFYFELKIKDANTLKKIPIGQANKYYAKEREFSIFRRILIEKIDKPKRRNNNIKKNQKQM